MLLTVSKRLEFSASRRLYVPHWTGSENLIAFGPESAARYGSGRNYVVYFIFSGAVDPITGMLINISEIKQRAGRIVDNQHWFQFSAARRTISPHLSESENAQLFGAAAGIHGHNYRVRLTFRRENFSGDGTAVRFDELEHCVHSLRTELDHRYLNEDV